jgi:bifunctional UDP-N-acetylglucosamine pyrophosphorylase/glucosamine-1-phosphate N-acetyltransferase
VADETEVLGVNSPLQLADLERRFQRRQADALMEAGVRLADPARFDLRGTLTCGRMSRSTSAASSKGGRAGRRRAHRRALRHPRRHIGAGAVIHPFTHIEARPRGRRRAGGPLCAPAPRRRAGRRGAHRQLRRGEEQHPGPGAKANHLAYLGDATVGERVNYGAGSITANYDGANKHRTVIGADVHVGSNCVLVAPVTLGDGATIGGGSTIAKPAPAGQLTVARAKQVTCRWTRPVKAKK